MKNPPVAIQLTFKEEQTVLGTKLKKTAGYNRFVFRLPSLFKMLSKSMKRFFKMVFIYFRSFLNYWFFEKEVYN